MGQDFEYCGECEECVPDDNLCMCSECGQEINHPCGHGFYCIDCISHCKYANEKRSKLFCDKQCYKQWKESKAKKQQEIINAKERFQNKKNKE
jgi:hypothetical protein